MVNLCTHCFNATTGVPILVGECALIFGMAVSTQSRNVRFFAR